MKKVLLYSLCILTSQNVFSADITNNQFSSTDAAKVQWNNDTGTNGSTTPSNPAITTNAATIQEEHERPKGTIAWQNPNTHVQIEITVHKDPYATSTYNSFIAFLYGKGYVTLDRTVFTLHRGGREISKYYHVTGREDQFLLVPDGTFGHSETIESKGKILDKDPKNHKVTYDSVKKTFTVLVPTKE